MSDTTAGWTETSVGELFALDSGTATVGFRPGDLSGPVQVYGANGPIGSSQVDNFGPGYLVGRVGAVGSITRVNERVWASDNTLTATPRPSRCDFRFAEHLLRFLNLGRLSTITAQPLITQANLGKLSASVPVDTTEQSSIASVLDTADEAIAKTEAVIAKLKQVRAGLLHDLLTCGLDENGELRDPVAHPEQFQDSLVGRIPVTWEVRSLESCVTSEITYGIVQAGPHIDGGVPYIRTGDMAGDRLIIEQMLRTSREIATRYQRSTVHVGEIVCAIRATVGKVLPVPPELDGANLTQGTARIAPKDEIDSTFLLWAIRSDNTQRQIALEVKGTTFAEITLANLRRIKVTIPSQRSEQERIATVIEVLETCLSSVVNELSKLQQLKSGLMDDLLTGRVRVPEKIAVTDDKARRLSAFVSHQQPRDCGADADRADAGISRRGEAFGGLVK
jgi:type I restriction enzyme S subunit